MEVKRLEAKIESWEVIWQSGVNIRVAKERSAACLGTRRKGAVVSGRQDGSWLALTDEPGFMLVADPDSGIVLLEKRAQQHSFGTATSSSSSMPGASASANT